MKNFLEKTIPEGFNALPEDVRQRANGDEVMQLELEGPGGGTWHFQVKDSKIVVANGANPKPTVVLATTVDGFKELTQGRLVATDSKDVAGMAKMMSQMFDQNKRTALKALKGTFKARYCDSPAPDESKVVMEMYIAFGGEAPNKTTPRMTILMPIETFKGIQTKKLQAPQVFMAGGMRLTGDMSMAMQMQALVV